MLRRLMREGDAESGAVPLDPDLAMVVERWNSLPDAVRAGIAAMVRLALTTA
jgi:hypothetical protein